MDLFAGLIDDAAMFPPGNATPADAVRAHRAWRASWLAPMLGPLVVADTRLAEVGRSAGAEPPLAVSVINSSGAGGLAAAAARRVPGVQVVAIESALRDASDLAGAVARLVAAAGELDPGIVVYVEFPYAPGWEDAVSAVEAAGLRGKLRTGGTEPTDYPSAEQLAEQLSVLIEADLAFKATAGLHRAWPNQAPNDRGQTLEQHGLLAVLIAVHALIEGADRAEAAALLRLTDRRALAETVAGWDPSTQAAVRRRFRSFGCCGVTDPIDDLVALGLVTAP